MAIQIERTHIKRKTILSISIIINILVLAFFKYIHSFVSNIYKESTDVSSPIITSLILPVGLSFLVFTLISYLIEVKRGTVKSEKHLGVFLSSMLFFPKIMQGPIERPQKLLLQFHQGKAFELQRLVDGIKMIIWGLFKKLVIAERLALYVNAVYGNVDNHNGTTLAIATIFYSFQIYADFSAYTDIALGSAKILGFDLSNNFNRPYFAKSIKEFWERWHITFSLWLRDYLFLPLAFFFSRKMKNENYLLISTEKWIYFFSIMITFGICGLWHGEGLTFIIWGLLFGILLTWSNWMSKPFKKLRRRLNINKQNKVFVAFKVTNTFILVSFLWIFFRANDTNQALSIIHKIFSVPGVPFKESVTTYIYGFFGLSILLIKEFHNEIAPAKFKFFEHKNPEISALSASLLILIILSIGVLDGGQFIYFQF